MTLNREHDIYKLRKTQLQYNSLAVAGGRNYIDSRLWRAPNETDLSWIGDPSRGIVGRKTRAALVNDAARVAGKINQYLFKKPTARQGADKVFLGSVDGAGSSCDRFFERISNAITACGWCWVQVDRTSTTADATLGDKGQVYWRLWSALDVVDWCLDSSGGIVWLIVHSEIYDNRDPRAPAQKVQVYTLYERRDDGVYITEEADGDTSLALRTNVLLSGLKQIPFVLIGCPSANGWWFDDVENIQAQILNLDSMHNETLMESVYPQLVLPQSLVQSLELSLRQNGILGERNIQLTREYVLGRKYPIIEGENDKGVSRYIAPGGELELLTKEASRKRALLFDIAGLALFNKETRQIQTAESKQFDQLDTNSTLANRARFLQDAETRLVAMSQMFDESFAAWTPAYNTDFDVVDVAALGQVLAETANLPDLTPATKRIIALATLRLLREVCGGIASEELFTEAAKEIEEKNFDQAEVPGFGVE